MSSTDTKLLYRHTGVGLLRAAAYPLRDAPGWWPDPSDTQACRMWLDQMWSRPEVADAIRHASLTLARRIDAIGAGHAVEDRKVRKATVSIARYMLRATGRPTPFGLFAGVAPMTLAPGAESVDLFPCGGVRKYGRRASSRFAILSLASVASIGLVK